jgi:hypothetical protein
MRAGAIFECWEKVIMAKNLADSAGGKRDRNWNDFNDDSGKLRSPP